MGDRTDLRRKQILELAKWTENEKQAITDVDVVGEFATGLSINEIHTFRR